MITGVQMYWLTRLDGIHDLLCGIMVASCVAWGILSVIAGVATFVSDTKEERQKAAFARRVWLGAALIALLSGLIHVFTPTTKELAAIIVVPRIANSQLVTEKIPQELSELYTLAKQYMVATLKEKVAEKEKK